MESNGLRGRAACFTSPPPGEVTTRRSGVKERTHIRYGHRRKARYGQIATR